MMRQILPFLIFLFSFSGTGCLEGSPGPQDTVAIARTLDSVARWQMENLTYQTEGNLHDRGINSWVNAVFYLGLSRWAENSSCAGTYDSWLNGIGEKTGWKMPANFRENPRYLLYHADEFCMGQVYLDLYEKAGKPEMIASVLERVDFVLENPGDTIMDYRNKQVWSWCDALFMAPPLYAGLARVTGERKYLDFMHREVRRMTGHLYDRSEKLFFRDDSYFDKREANGQKIFWGRGNGWVLAGLADILRFLPEDAPETAYYTILLKEMSERLAGLQDENGYWHASLLDPESYPSPETSATALITYGLAYGINRGVLDPVRYRPCVMKAWDWLVSVVDEEGKVGWVQPIGADPKKVTGGMTAPYGPGALLLAGNEIYNLIVKENLK